MQRQQPNVSVSLLGQKNKRLQFEYSDFGYKVAYFLVNSSCQTKSVALSETEPIFMKCPDKEIEINKLKFEARKNNPMKPSAVTITRWHEHLQNFYTPFRRFDLGLDSNKPKRNVLIRFKEMFDDNSFDASIIVYCGPATMKGGLIIESKDYGIEELFFVEVLNEWNRRTSKQNHLLLILDCNYSGKWVADFNNYHERIETVSIFAATRENQKAAYFDLGYYFTHNIIKLLAKNIEENMVPLTQVPCFIGDYLDCKKYTNLYINFNSWSTLMAVQKSEYAMINYDNGIYLGHMEDGQKQFWGSFTWKNGAFKNCKYSGEFHRGKLHGKGILRYTNGRVYEGDFKNNSPDGLAVESYENGDKYIGKFLRGYKSGYGIYVYSNGEIYEGQFEENKPSGHGKLTMPKNCFYEGSFKNGKCNGFGRYTYENGDSYEGNWVDSVKHGKGIYRYVNGDIYEGYFVNGLRHGYGKLMKATGEVYQGGWENDMMSGEGQYNSLEDQIIGEWIKGKITKTPTYFSKIGTQKIHSEF